MEFKTGDIFRNMETGEYIKLLISGMLSTHVFLYVHDKCLRNIKQEKYVGTPDYIEVSDLDRYLTIGYYIKIPKKLNIKKIYEKIKNE